VTKPDETKDELRQYEMRGKKSDQLRSRQNTCFAKEREEEAKATSSDEEKHELRQSEMSGK
jgi:hypothetical protein